MIQGLEQLQHAADYQFYFQHLRRDAPLRAAVGMFIGGMAAAAWDETSWLGATFATFAIWALADAALRGDPLGRGWLRERPFAIHWLFAAFLLIQGGLILAERSFDPPPPSLWLQTLSGVFLLVLNSASVVAHVLALIMLGKSRPLPGMLKRLDRQIAAIKFGDLARDQSLLEFTNDSGKTMRAALRPGLVMLLERHDHLKFYRRKEFVITPGEPGQATLRRDDKQLDIALTPGMLERYRRS
jgi:hypothetical protein